MFATIADLTQGCFTWVLVLFAGLMVLKKLSKPPDGGGRVGAVAKKAVTRAVFKRK
jgi:hypothetical protein